ncbi:MAG: hypothetical protein M1309_02385 [Actinobacteria bacterium]|nr:hypothetical protein [Actinomycetota bacterium]
MKKGVILLVIGAIGLIAVYSVRPPSGLGDELMMVEQGRNFYLKEPVYLSLMALSGVILFFGVISIFKSVIQSSAQSTNKE